VGYAGEKGMLKDIVLSFNLKTPHDTIVRERGGAKNESNSQTQLKNSLFIKADSFSQKCLISNILINQQSERNEFSSISLSYPHLQRVSWLIVCNNKINIQVILIMLIVFFDTDRRPVPAG
jgi:hypothetical protein